LRQWWWWWWWYTNEVLLKFPVKFNKMQWFLFQCLTEQNVSVQKSSV
jgi:hypothetical protein